MKKQTVCMLAAALCVGSILAGCGSKEPQQTTVPPTAEPAVTESVPETTAPAATTAPTETTAPETSVPTVPATSAPAESTEPASANAPSGKYVDLDNMQFSINGKTYTLGKTTLQELIDDGVPFREDDLANAGNNLNKNSQSQGFRIDLDEYWTAQVFVLNDTDDNKTASECYVNEVYLPLKKDNTQDILTFAFPQNMTMDELKANAGEPTDSSHYDGEEGYYTDKLEYTKESTKYLHDGGYTFEFMKGVLQYITIEYMP